MKLKTLLNDYDLVYCFFKKPVYQLKEDGFFEVIGKKRGVLVRRIHSGDVWHHLPEDYLVWKKDIESMRIKDDQ